MKHADKLMERIFTLDGLPNLQDLGKIMIGEDVPEILSCDHKLETFAQGTVKDGIAYCESVRSYVSRDLLQMILDDTEEHIDFGNADGVGRQGRRSELPAIHHGRCDRLTSDGPQTEPVPGFRVTQKMLAYESFLFRMSSSTLPSHFHDCLCLQPDLRPGNKTATSSKAACL